MLCEVPCVACKLRTKQHPFQTLILLAAQSWWDLIHAAPLMKRLKLFQTVTVIVLNLHEQALQSLLSMKLLLQTQIGRWSRGLQPCLSLFL